MLKSFQDCNALMAALRVRLFWEEKQLLVTAVHLKEEAEEGFFWKGLLLVSTVLTFEVWNYLAICMNL